MAQTTKQQIQAAFPNMQENEFGNHCSDLHVKHSPELWEWLQSNLEYPQNVQKFHSAIDGTLWVDIPFHFSEYHTRSVIYYRAKIEG